MKFYKSYRGITSNINDDYAFEIAGLYKYREFKDGISFLQLDIDWDRYPADHHPKFTLLFAIFNFMILEITIYNRHHYCPECKINWNE
jgi:hypothetical protein